MTPTNYKLLEMIVDNKSIDEICSSLNITHNQLKSRIKSIKNEGYRVDTMYSNINKDRLYINYKSYSLDKPFIKTCDIDDSVLIGLVADTHIGSELCDMDAIKRVYEYFNKNGIHFVFHLGDLVDGDFRDTFGDIDSQVLSAILDYPSDESIKNFIVFGNHDKDFVERTGIDIGGAVSYYRDDFISLGYADAYVNLCDANIKLVHKAGPSDGGIENIIIGGHTHKYRFFANKSIPRIICPALSNVNPYQNYGGALTMKLSFTDDKATKMLLSQLMVIDNKVIEVGENSYQFCKKKK